MKTTIFAMRVKVEPAHFNTKANRLPSASFGVLIYLALFGRPLKGFELHTLSLSLSLAFSTSYYIKEYNEGPVFSSPYAYIAHTGQNLMFYFVMKISS